MLVLSRQRDETIMIGEDVQITVVDIRGDKVRIGITAPQAVRVHRKEVFDEIQIENAEASRAAVAPADLHRLDRALVDRTLARSQNRERAGGARPRVML